MAAVSPDGWHLKLQQVRRLLISKLRLHQALAQEAGARRLAVQPKRIGRSTVLCDMGLIARTLAAFYSHGVGGGGGVLAGALADTVGGFGKPPMDAHFERKRNCRLLPQFGAWGCRHCDSKPSNLRLLVWRSGGQSSMGTRAQLAGFVSSPVSKRRILRFALALHAGRTSSFTSSRSAWAGGDNRSRSKFAIGRRSSSLRGPKWLTVN